MDWNGWYVDGTVLPHPDLFQTINNPFTTYNAAAEQFFEIATRKRFPGPLGQKDDQHAFMRVFHSPPTTVQNIGEPNYEATVRLAPLHRHHAVLQLNEWTFPQCVGKLNAGVGILRTERFLAQVSSFVLIRIAAS